ncbi:MAG: GNAT family N-acetyltransferase [Candidatus Doudnabacteria bacterium]|nr:GNAT family N-acetyltransferase [Candidatus Doudnabacteria bacterium]
MKIRDLTAADLIGVRQIYREAFAGFPWFETVTDAEIDSRFNSVMSGLVAVQDNSVVGATWWEVITIEKLRQERGEELVRFANTFREEHLKYVWVRETIVLPSHQGQGIGLMLKQDSIKRLHEVYKPVMILTRMRDDNLPIIRIAERCGFARTGIKVPDSQVLVNHEYWYYKEVSR